jgi:hypothetical protein
LPLLAALLFVAKRERDAASGESGPRPDISSFSIFPFSATVLQCASVELSTTKPLSGKTGFTF